MSNNEDVYRRSSFHVPQWMDLSQQSKIAKINDTEEEVHYSVFSRHENDFVERFDDNICTLLDNFVQACEKHANLPCLGTRKSDEKKYEFLTYSQVFARAKNFGSGLVKVGINPGKRICTYISSYVHFYVTDHSFLYIELVNHFESKFTY